jgi:hypothetical protein
MQPDRKTTRRSTAGSRSTYISQKTKKRRLDLPALEETIASWRPLVGLSFLTTPDSRDPAASRSRRRSVAGLAQQARKSQHRDRQEAYLARIGRLFLDAPADVLESFILDRRDKKGANIHAVALARKRNANLPRERLSEWGRKGAEALWRKRRDEVGEQIHDSSHVVRDIVPSSRRSISRAASRNTDY